MRLLDKHGNATATIISQRALEEKDTVYNFEVQDFHTYHIGELGVWVHNADCCRLGRNHGRAINTGHKDNNGNSIYERVNAEGKGQSSFYIEDSNGKQQRVDSPYERSGISEQRDYHNGKVAEYRSELEAKGYTVDKQEASFGYSCGREGRCRPDIIARDTNGKVVLFEVKTGNAELSIRQSEIYPQIENGEAIPRGDVALKFDLKPGIPLKEQGYPNGIPIETITYEGLNND